MPVIIAIRVLEMGISELRKAWRSMDWTLVRPLVRSSSRYSEEIFYISSPRRYLAIVAIGLRASAMMGSTKEWSCCASVAAFVS